VKSKFDKYKIVKRLAIGGLSEIFLATEGDAASLLNRQVIIKKLLPQFAENEKILPIIQNEARLLAALSHANIVQVFEAGVSSNSEPYMVLEYIDGYDLSTIFNLLGDIDETIPISAIYYITEQCLRGLVRVHELRDRKGRLYNLIHRDISPNNIMVSISGDVKILDFGLAKRVIDISRSGNLTGKIPYLSTEQILGKRVDCKSDLFSLGTVIYEIASGKRRFQGETDIAILQRIGAGKYRPLSAVANHLPAPFVNILEKAMKVNPLARYQSARDMLNDLTRLPAKFSKLQGGRSDLVDFLEYFFGETKISNVAIPNFSNFNANDANPIDNLIEPPPAEEYENLQNFLMDDQEFADSIEQTSSFRLIPQSEILPNEGNEEKTSNFRVNDNKREVEQKTANFRANANKREVEQKTSNLRAKPRSVEEPILAPQIGLLITQVTPPASLKLPVPLDKRPSESGFRPLDSQKSNFLPPSAFNTPSPKHPNSPFSGSEQSSNDNPPPPRGAPPRAGFNPSPPRGAPRAGFNPPPKGAPRAGFNPPPKGAPRAGFNPPPKGAPRAGFNPPPPGAQPSGRKLPPPSGFHPQSSGLKLPPASPANFLPPPPPPPGAPPSGFNPLTPVVSPLGFPGASPSGFIPPPPPPPQFGVNSRGYNPSPPNESGSWIKKNNKPLKITVIVLGAFLILTGLIWGIMKFSEKNEKVDKKVIPPVHSYNITLMGDYKTSEVFLDGKKVGKLPITFSIKEDKKNHLIEVKCKKYHLWKKKIQPVNDETIFVKLAKILTKCEESFETMNKCVLHKKLKGKDRLKVIKQCNYFLKQNTIRFVRDINCFWAAHGDCSKIESCKPLPQKPICEVFADTRLKCRKKEVNLNLVTHFRRGLIKKCEWHLKQKKNNYNTVYQCFKQSHQFCLNSKKCFKMLESLQIGLDAFEDRMLVRRVKKLNRRKKIWRNKCLKYEEKCDKALPKNKKHASFFSHLICGKLIFSADQKDIKKLKCIRKYTDKCRYIRKCSSKK
jgi:serine/threonine protein kinase